MAVERCRPGAASATNLTSPVWTNTTNAIQDTNAVFSTSVPLDGAPRGSSGCNPLKSFHEASPENTLRS
jgi:hypothetical protein